MSDPKCPYCGAEMLDDAYTWYCPECHSSSPVVIYEEKCQIMSEVEKKAYAREAAYRRPQLRPLSFDECMVYGDTEQQTDMIPDPVWLEYRDPDGWTGWICLQDHVYHPLEDPRGRGLYIMHPGCDVEGKSEYEADYGKTWRCWSRRPTDQEKAEAEWNG